MKAAQSFRLGRLAFNRSAAHRSDHELIVGVLRDLEPLIRFLVGASLIVGSGIYTLHREAVRRRSLTATATPAA
jgi:hypothetical protein